MKTTDIRFCLVPLPPSSSVSTLWMVPSLKLTKETHEHPTNSLAKLKSLGIRNHSNAIFSYLNISSIRNKFDNLKPIIDEIVDILCVAETKIDISSIQLDSKSYRLYISERRGWLLVYIRFHLPFRRLSYYTTPKNIQIIPLELNLRS